jgi:hypothetical protein
MFTFCCKMCSSQDRERLLRCRLHVPHHRWNLVRSHASFLHVSCLSLIVSPISAALSNNKTFPSRSGPHESKTKYFEVFVRRLFRIFSHVRPSCLYRPRRWISHCCRRIFIIRRISHGLKIPRSFTSGLRYFRSPST